MKRTLRSLSIKVFWLTAAAMLCLSSMAWPIAAQRPAGGRTDAPNPTPISAADTRPLSAKAILSAPDVAVDPGAEAIVPINLLLPLAIDIYSIEFTMTWDSTVLTATEAAVSDMTSGWIISTNTTTPGEARVALAGISPLASEGDVAEITFAAAAVSGMTSVLEFGAVELNEGTLAVTATNGLVSVDDPNAASVSLALYAGWNLVSAPLMPDEACVDGIVASASPHCQLIYGYDPLGEPTPWQRYDPRMDTQQQVTDTLSVGHAVWVHMSTPVTVELTGTKFSDTEIALETGWNLMGYPSSVEQSVADLLAPIVDQVEVIMGYDASEPEGTWYQYVPYGAPEDNTLSTLVPGAGYWLLAKSPVTVTIP